MTNHVNASGNSLSRRGGFRRSGRLSSVLAAGLGIVAQSTALAADPDPSLVLDEHARSSVQAIPLPAAHGEENWSSVLVEEDGRVLVGMSSRTRSGSLLRADVDERTVERVMSLDAVGRLLPDERQPKIHVTPVREADGWYHFITHHGLETHLPLHGSRLGYQGMRHWRWHPEQEVGEHLGRLIAGEGAVAMSSAGDGRHLYVVSFPQGLLLQVDITTGRVHNFGRCNAVFAPRHIVVDPAGRAYVLDHGGRFWRADAAGGRLTPLEQTLPGTDGVSGNLLAQGFVAETASADRTTWHLMSAWGRLYRVRFRGDGEPTVDDLGAPADLVQEPNWHPPTQRPVTGAGLARDRKGRFYIAIAGYNRAADDSGDCFVMRFDPADQRAELLVRLDGERVSYICGSNAVDHHRGRVFFVASHLKKDQPHLIVVETD